MDICDHLFRREHGRMVAVLTHLFGIHNLALAEDVVQDAFCRALEVWKFSGVPENPSAWLMITAKNRAKDILRRERTALKYAPELGRLLESEWTLSPTVEAIFETKSIEDDQLRMMFTCCNPLLTEAAQIALILRVVCGFGAEEAANAFLIGHDAMEKRITRAKKVLAGSKTLFDLRDSDFPLRLSAVHRTLYLLFSEGYHAAGGEQAVRVELCMEAMRLAALLVKHPLTSCPATYALSALMHLHAARIPARIDRDGSLITLEAQDRSQWNAELITEGQRLLDLSATGVELSQYHLEAAIAAVHAYSASVQETNWGMIISLYDALMEISPSPVVALNRAVAVAQHEGPERGIEEIHAIAECYRLKNYPFYYAALGEMELLAGNCDGASRRFSEAISLARNPAETRLFTRRLGVCKTALTDLSTNDIPCQTFELHHSWDAIPIHTGAGELE